jgi:hypothetical protein
MTPFEKQLYSKIEAFKFDEPNTQLTFAARLARENGWNPTYTNRVIEEYKKFIFLCCTSATAVTPSDPVDQAWHLHLTYTKSYWHNLCRDTLDKDIHHNPTKGGIDEQEKFSGLYDGLHTSYLQKFGCPPPTDIWHDNKTRFNDTDFRRVNLRRYWLVRKQSPKHWAIAMQLLIMVIAICGIQVACGTVLAIFFAVIMLVAVLKGMGKNNKDKGTKGSSGGLSFSCFTFSCSADSHSYSHVDSGCNSSGCNSGCSSGCSGCGGGCGGGD